MFMTRNILDFSDYIIEHTRDFTGREWVFTQIDRWLANPDAPPFFIITGEPGIGKTAIAAQLVRISNGQAPEPAGCISIKKGFLNAAHFCIRQQVNTVEPLEFVQSLYSQLLEIEGFTEEMLENKGVEGQTAVPAYIDMVINPLKALHDRDPNRQTVIVVDSLDEAARMARRDTIVDLLANTGRLPAGVRFILTTRPEDRVLRRFDERNVPYLLLDVTRGGNPEDIRRYIQEKLSSSNALAARLAENHMDKETFIEAAGEACKGNFLYLVWLLPAIAGGKQGLDDPAAFPVGLDGIYQAFLRTRIGNDLDQWRKSYRLLLGVLIAAQEPLAIDQLTRFTGLEAQEVRDILIDVQQVLSPSLYQQGLYQPYHQSIVGFLTHADRAGELWIDPQPIHDKIADLYLSEYNGRWAACDRYGLRHLPFHLAQAGRLEDLRRLLLDFSWLQAKLEAADISSILVDYDFSAHDEELHLAQGALRLSAHALAKNKSEMAGQLVGRLLACEQPGIQGLVGQAKEWRGKPWLRPLTASLMLPGPLLLTLEGHRDDVSAVALHADGRRAISASKDKTLKVWDLESGECLRTLEGHEGVVSAVALYADGELAVSASWDETLKVWDLESGECLCTLKGHHIGVNAVVIHADGKRAVSASKDRTLKVWDLERGTIIASFQGDSEITCCVIMSDEQTIVAGEESGRMHFLKLEGWN